MKIGILTQPLVNNYGGILQNFALQTVLKRAGHTPVTINFEHQPLAMGTGHFLASVLKRLARRALGQKQKYINPYKEDRAIFSIQPEQYRFIKEYITKVDVTKSLTEEDDLVNKFDAFVVGSDQVWRPLYSPHITNFFLDFAHKNQRKIAYAASFGTDSWEFSSELTETATRLLKKFDGISVREEGGIRLCNDYLDCTVIHVLDPTLLLRPDDYIESLSLDTDFAKQDISTYILDDDQSKFAAISHISDSMNLRINSIGKVKDGRLQSIEKWLNDIRNSELVITDSFHGTVFSILFHKQFISFYNPARGNSRMISLLKSVGLENRLVEPRYIEKALAQDIRWDDVDRQLNRLRTGSLSFLLSSINGK